VSQLWYLGQCEMDWPNIAETSILFAGYKVNTTIKTIDYKQGHKQLNWFVN